MSFSKSDISSILPGAFSNPKSCFYSCNTGADISKNDVSFAQAWVNRVGGTLVAGGIWVYDIFVDNTESKEDVIADFVSRVEKFYPGETVIYRKGSGSYQNLTPRFVDITGLSYYLTPPETGPYTITTIERINNTGILTAVIDGKNHVSVKGVNNHLDWMLSRADASSNPHSNTILLQSISAKIKIK